MKSFIYNIIFFRSETIKPIRAVVLLSVQMPFFFQCISNPLKNGITTPIRAILPATLLALTVCFAYAQSCIAWQTILGEPTLDERAKDIWIDKTTETFWVCGYQTNFNSNGITNKNGWLMHFNSSGALMEDFVIQDTANLILNAQAKTEDSFILAGYRYPTNQPNEKTAWLALFNENSIQWSISKTVKSEIKETLVLSDNQIYITGLIEENEARNQDIFVEQYDISGNKLWQKNYGGTKDEDANAMIFHQNQLLVVGFAASSDGDISNALGGKDVWLLAIDPKDGTLTQQKNFGGTSNDVAKDLTQLPNGEIAFLAESLSNNGDINNSIGSGDFWVAKIDTQWNIIWEKSYGGFNADFSNAITSFSNGDLLITGTTFSENGDINTNYGFIDSWLSRINYADGSIIWSEVIGGNDLDHIEVLHIYDEQKIIAAGHTDSFDIQCKRKDAKHSNQNVWVLGLDTLLLNTDEFLIDEQQLLHYTIQNTNLQLYHHYINPLNVLITDVNGKVYYKTTIKSQLTENINFSHWEKGIYILFYKYKNGKFGVKKVGLL